MARLSLTLRGGFHAGLDDDRTPALSIKKAQALLAYLSIPAGKSHLRDKLATLLWGEMREAQARGGLRRALFTLRRALGDAKPLRLEGEGVALDPALVAIDVQEFEECAGFRDQPCSATRSTRAGIARAVRWARSAGRTRWSGAHPRAAPRRRAARGAALEGERGDHRRAIERMRWVAGALKDASIDEHFGRVGLPPTSACRPWLALCLATDDFAETLAWGGEGLRIAEAVGGPHERVWPGYCLAGAHLARGGGAQAIPLLEKAIALCEDRIPLFRPRVVASLGRALTMAGDLDAARPLFAQAMAEAEAIKLLFGHAMILIWTAAAHLDAGRNAEAERYGSTALELARRHGARADERWALHALGEIAARREPPASELALEHGTRALTIAQALEMAPLQARCDLSLGALHHQAGRTAEARGALARAVEMLQRMQMRYWLPTAEALLAATS